MDSPLEVIVLPVGDRAVLAEQVKPLIPADARGRFGA